MRKLLVLVLATLVLCGSCSTERPARILFVGNSLTYVGNLPAVFSALARANGHVVDSYMVVSPGGRLSERVADGSVGPALRQCDCSILIMQERGGDLFGGFGDDAMAASKHALARLTDTGRGAGASVVLLGTYNSPAVTHELVTMERAAAQEAGIPYVAVAEQFWHMRKVDGALPWMSSDRMHPGKALTLLQAILLYKQLYDSYPQAKAFVVDAPIYGSHSGLTPVLRQAGAQAPNPDTVQGVSYAADEVQKLLPKERAP